MIEAGISARWQEPEGLVVDDVNHANRVHGMRVYGSPPGSAGRTFATHWRPAQREGRRLADAALGDAYAILGIEPGSGDEEAARPAWAPEYDGTGGAGRRPAYGAPLTHNRIPAAAAEGSGGP